MILGEYIKSRISKVLEYKKNSNNTIWYRLINRMKLTALIPDNLIEKVREYTQGKDITEPLIKALAQWIQTQKASAKT